MATGRLTARPTAPPTGTTAPASGAGLHPLGLGSERDGLRYVPEHLPQGQPAPLVTLFHGAGGSAAHTIDILRPRADAHGLIVVAPDSRGRTWDLLRRGFGPDVDVIDDALAQTFAHHAIDPARIALAGFSDGASYALSLGLTNGDLVSHVIAFSPGFLSPATIRGSPRIYVSHGIHDDVLPIGHCSRRIVPALEDAGFDVTYQEFDGPHTVPPEIVDDALAWLDQEPPGKDTT